MLFVITSSGGAGGGGHQGAAGGPQVARAGVGSAGVQRVVRGGTTPTPASTPARPESRELGQKYKENFTVTDPEIALNEGFDRINDGQYR